MIMLWGAVCNLDLVAPWMEAAAFVSRQVASSLFISIGKMLSSKAVESFTKLEGVIIWVPSTLAFKAVSIFGV